MKPQFSKLTISGFRRLRKVEFPLESLTVVIGANGVGKTSLLDIMSLLAASAAGRLNGAISELGGISSLLTYDACNRLTMELSMNVENHEPIEYSIDIVPSALAYSIENETLTQQRNSRTPFKYIDSHLADIRYFEKEDGKLQRPNWLHNQLESSLAQVPKMFTEPEQFRSALASSTLYHALNVAPRAPVRMPQPMQPAPLPGKDGEDLASCLYFLRETERDRFDSIEDTLRVAFPTFERLEFPPVAAGTMALAWKDRNFTRQLYAHQLSEGTLRFLWLTALLHSPTLPAVTMIDEPEVSLHPEMLRLLAELFREAAQRTQLIVATHSDRLVRFLEPHELAVMNMEEDGSSSLARADSFDLEAWLKDYALDELWRMGRLGGRS